MAWPCLPDSVLRLYFNKSYLFVEHADDVRFWRFVAASVCDESPSDKHADNVRFWRFPAASAGDDSLDKRYVSVLLLHASEDASI